VKIKLSIIFFISIFFCFGAKAQVWQWVKGSTNGGGDDEGYAVGADFFGNGYVTGSFVGPIITFGSITLSTSTSSGDEFITKYNIKGNVVWAKNAGGSGLSAGQAICTDLQGNVYVTGYFGSPGISLGTISLVTGSSGANMFVAKYDSTGRVVWAKSAGGSGTDVGNSLAVDAKGNVYVTGMFSSPSIKFGATTLVNKGSDNVFLTKYDSTGKVVWAKSAGGTGADGGQSVGTDVKGNVYITGTFNSPSIKFGTTVILTNAGNVNIFLARYDSLGNVLWAKKAGGTVTDVGLGLSVSAKGSIYITGYFTSPTIIFGPNTLTGSGSGNSYLAKYDTLGNPLWARGSLGTVGDLGYAVCTNANDDTYLAGGFSDTITMDGFTLTPPAFSNDPMYLIKFNSAGNGVWAKALSSGGDDKNGISLTGCGNIYTGGDFETSPFIVGKDSLTPSGSESVFIALITDTLSSAGFITVSANASPATICSGATTSLNASGTTNYTWSPITGLSCSTCPNTIASPSVTTSYIVTGKTGTCTGTQTVTVTVDNKPSPVISPAQSICEGNSVSLTASGGTGYSWNNGATSSTITVFPSVATTYTVTVFNGPCSAKDSVQVNVNPLPITNVCCDTVISDGQSVQLTSNGGGTYQWIPGTGLSCNNCPNPVASPNVNTTYTLLVTSDSGCTVQKTVTIDIDCRSIFVPNAFSPNGDGENDFECVYGGCIKTLSFAIFDRWGNRVFETNDQKVCWDGRYIGQPMNTGMYVYYLEAELENGDKVSRKGNITLVR
jgi:gliding motility-associated-like protein